MKKYNKMFRNYYSLRAKFRARYYKMKYGISIDEAVNEFGKKEKPKAFI